MLEVAQAAGVSNATVSRALKDDPRIRAEVRQKVKAAALALGYAPNPLVQALMTQRRRKLEPHGETIALVTNVSEEAWRKKDVCIWYWKGLRERAAQLGYQLEVFSMEDLHINPARLKKVLVARGIRGVILGFSQRDDLTTVLDVSDFCVVGLSTYFSKLPVDRVQLHGFYNVKLAFRQMRALGYHRPGLIAPVRNNAIVGGQWSAAALDEQWQRPVAEQCPPLMVESDVLDTKSFREWFEKHQPDALLVYKIGVMELLGRLRVAVPGDVGVAHLFGTETERETMAGIDGNLDRVGAATVDLLVQKMHIHERGMPEHPREVLITGTWQPGATLPERSPQARSARRSIRAPVGGPAPSGR
ncbi:MAG: LacI family transcriptional regulator, fructose operon transcriptional repressor [Verrucomicrobiaceae bacterium]|nr:LacI family transcriptional regulator, fructose operon transcriptional repressor [Verrucomicrobiaceae bacterium]